MSDREVKENTVEYMIPKQFDNLLQNKARFFKDMKEWELDGSARIISRVVILGTGPSRKAYMQRSSDFTVGNQTSGGDADAIIITDAGVKAGKTFLKPKLGQDLFLASVVDPGLVEKMKLWKHKRVWGFHHPLIGGGNILDSVYRSLCPEGIVTNIIQVGCATNAAILLVARLMDLKKIPKVPIHLAGVDYADEKVGITPQFEAYAKDNAFIVELLKKEGFLFSKEKSDSPLNGWIEEV